MTARFALLLALSASLSAQTTVRADNAKPPAPSTNGADSSLSQALASADELLHASKFPEAAVAYKAILEKEPTAANAHVGLMRSLVRSQQLSEAEEAGKQAIQAAPLSDLVHATYGDVNFRIGQMGTAEAEYRTALKLDANSARGLYGMGRMYAMVGMNKRAKEVFAKAHEADPKDRQIYDLWLGSLPDAEKLEVVRKSAGDHATEREQQRIKFLSTVVEKKPWVLTGEPRRAELKMQLYGRTLQDGGINRGPMMIAKGFGLDIKFNDRASATLLLDTGASGITIGHKLAEKAGVVKIADTFIRGIGDQGAVASYIGWADKINIAGIEFKNCIVEVSSKSGVAEEAGLVGADVFKNFLITLDFNNLKLLLAPLPENPNAPANDDEPQDRYIAPEMQSYTKVWRFGHFLVLPVVVSDKAAGNFILDTGADINIVSKKLAKQITKLNYEGYSMKGVSGSVKEVLNGDKAILQFARLRVRSDDIPVLDLPDFGGSAGTEFAGLIGIRTLSQMKLTIDYRDGLVNFDLYESKPAREITWLQC